MPSPLNDSDQLGHVFKDPGLLRLALTHRSCCGEQHNERLEFLGDAVLNMVITRFLYLNYPDINEGKLSRLRAHLVNGESLAKIAQQLGLGGFIRLGQGEEKSGGRKRPSILANCVEAIIGAVFLDDGYGAAEAVIIGWYRERLTNIRATDAFKDPKTRLQEYLQALGYPLPQYQAKAMRGTNHSQHFTVTCRVKSIDGFAQGQGQTRREAEKHAAEVMLSQLLDRHS